MVSVPPKRTPPNILNSRAPLEQQADDLEEVLVPAHRDAVFGDAAEARHDARAQVLAQLGDIADRPERHARARRLDAGDVGGSGSIFSPSIATTVWPSFIR